MTRKKSVPRESKKWNKSLPRFKLFIKKRLKKKETDLKSFWKNNSEMRLEQIFKETLNKITTNN